MPKGYLPGMGFYVTESYQMEADPLPKNRVGVFRDPSIIHARRFPAQVVEPHQEVVTLDSSTVSGVGEWLSNDPIGISGGFNQYVFCGNNPVNFRDPMGLCGTHSRFTDGGTHIQNYLEALNLVDFSPYLHPFRFYDWSWHGGRDLRGTGREFIYQGEAFGDSGFGNFTPAYALTIRYGVVQANIFLAGANMMGFMQSWFIDKDGSIFKAYFDTQGRKAFQRVGINAAVKRIGGQ